METLLEAALNSQAESTNIEFKSGFDTSSNQDWCEIIKDIVAIANSGGGIIIFGVDDLGEPNGNDVSSIWKIDPADLANKIVKYTGVNFTAFEILKCNKKKYKLAALQINESLIPIIFCKPGTYAISGGKQKTAFGKGTIYFRHGAKSEPGNSDDLRKSIERELERIKDFWLGNIRKVIEAPRTSQVIVLGEEVKESDSPAATPIRITNDANAPVYRKIDRDITHPYRQTDLVEVVNKKLSGKHNVNSHDIQAIKVSHKIAEIEKFCCRPKFSGFQYNEEFADWIVKNYNNDPDFFDKARKEWYKIRYRISK